MNRYFIRLAFDGTNYHGWQIQENAETVQDEINRALSAYLGHPCSTTGCGRTDTGVHALIFYLHFDTEKNIINHRQFIFKINQLLPPDVVCYELFKVDKNAHARFDATSRTYQYYISRVKDPFTRFTSWYLYGDIDLTLMNRASGWLESYTDFAAFSKGGPQESTDCVLHNASWTEDDQLLIFTVTANRFLRNMVRAMVGTLVDIGRKKIPPEELHLILQRGDRSRAGKSAPARGLFLTGVTYKEGVLN